MNTPRVVITGHGWVTPLGTSINGVWQRLLSAETAIGRVTRFDAASFKTPFAAEVKGFDLAEHLPVDQQRPSHEGVGLQTSFALAAAWAAWQQSGLGEHAGLDRSGVGVYLGSGEGPPDHAALFDANLRAWDGDSRSMDMPLWAATAQERFDRVIEVEQEPQAAVAHVADLLGLSGPSMNCMTACAASTQSVGEAFEMIRRGDAVAMVAGGTHSMIHPLGMTGFIRLTAMSTRADDPATASRPFNRTRDGFVMGEGAGMLVLEDADHAVERGANILCELVGYGSTADAFRITDIQPDGRGAQLAMSKALRQAGIDPTTPDAQGRPPVQYISAHGTGTPENDGIETTAVKGVFGEQAPRLCFSSVKSMLGHLIQAAGAVELITCVQAIKTGIVPPTANLHEPDPECDLDHVPNTPRDLNNAGGVDVCLSNGFGFGGQNDCVAVRRWIPTG
mgnify:CR=1 FL=1